MNAANPITPLPHAAPVPSALMDEELEMALLGGLLINPDAALFTRVAYLTVDAFALPKNKRLWVAMQALHERGIEINLETVRAEIGSISLEGEKHFEDLIRHAGERVGSYSKRLEEFEALRLLEANLQQGLKLTRDRKHSLAQKSDQINSLVTDALIKVSSVTGVAAYNMAEMSARYYETYLDQDVSGVGISTGWPDLDAQINGFEKGRVYLIGAGPGVGKSIKIQNIACHLNQGGRNGLIITLELPESEYMLRGLSCEMQVDMNRIKQMRLSEAEMAHMGEAIEHINARGKLLVLRMKTPTLAQLKSKITELTIAHGLSFVGIDYVAARHMTPDKDYRGDDVRFLAAISQAFTSLAKDLKLIIFPLVQLTQESLKRGGAPTITDFAGTGALAQDADVAMILKDETPYAPSMGFGETRAYIVKSRTGGEGNFVRFEAIKKFFTFSGWRGQ